MTGDDTVLKKLEIKIALGHSLPKMAKPIMASHRAGVPLRKIAQDAQRILGDAWGDDDDELAGQILVDCALLIDQKFDSSLWHIKTNGCLDFWPGDDRLEEFDRLSKLQQVESNPARGGGWQLTRAGHEALERWASADTDMR